MNKEIIKEIFTNLPNDIIATTHKDPDFDAIGSLLALKELVESLNKSITLLSPDMIKDQFYSLPGINAIIDKPEKKHYELAIFLDCSDKSRIAQFKKFPKVDKIINIDHHQDNTNFGDINLVENISSVGELLFNCFKTLNINISKSTAANLFAAISFDTGSFQFSNTTDETFIAAAELKKTGINITKVSELIFENKEKNYFEDIKMGLNNVYIDDNHPFLIVNIPFHDHFSKISTINFFRQYKDIELVIVCKEVKQNEFKLSFRSKQFIDVSKIAKNFNGGGHKKAAGGYIKKEKEKLHNELVSICTKAFE